MFDSSNEREEKTLQGDEKFWGGGRKGVKFHFEVFFEIFAIVKCMAFRKNTDSSRFFFLSV